MSKLRAIENSIQHGSMPLASYTLVHPEARLTDKEKATLLEWLKETENNEALR
jgi:hypothetical protein